MIVLGLTGSIAMGKSTAAQMLRQMGVPVHCSDDAVRDLYNDPDVIAVIAETFPKAYERKHKSIDKARLIGELKGDHEKWDALEDILHPYVRASQQKFLREQKAAGVKIAALDIPLLFETGAERRVDYTIVVTAPPFIQRHRLDERIRAGRLSEEDLAFRMARQMPDADKRSRADFLVQTGQGLAYTRAELKRIIRDVTERHFGNGNEHRRVPSHRL